MLLNLSYGGVDYLQYSTTELIEAGVPNALIDTATYNYKLDYIRQKRDEYLDRTDWTQMPDVPMTPEKRTEYANYRQVLRDITNNLDDPDNVTWPQKPA